MKKSSLFQTLVSAVASIAILTPSVAMANSYVASIRNQLVSAANTAGFWGLSLHDVDAGNLGSRDSEWMTVNLRAGVPYTFIGVCDQDCRDVDLHLYDDNGNLVRSDTGYDDFPVVAVTPRWSGQFTVKISMASCSANYCYYGLGMFK